MVIISEEINNSKIKSDISFIKKIILFAKQLKWRIVISGGYGLDGYLRTITRSHGDLDIILYGQEKRVQAGEEIRTFIETHIKDSVITINSEDYYLEIDVHGHNFVGNIYYVQTVKNPYKDLNQVYKMDGTLVINSSEDFPPPQSGDLCGLVVEVQDQKAHLEDILRKRKSERSLPKHDQDIQNIKSLII